MLSDLKTVYWDACVPLSYINGTQNRIPHIEGLLKQSGKDLRIITSVFTVTEVAFAKAEQDAKVLDATVEAKISMLWQVGAPIQLVEFYEVIAAKARELMRAAIPHGWSLKPNDAIHLATADHLKVSEMHSYDEKLYKYKELTDTHFPICRPVATQPIIDFDAHHTEEGTNEPAEPNPQETAISISPGIRSSPSSPGEDQARTESKEKTEEQK